MVGVIIQPVALLPITVLRFYIVTTVFSKQRWWREEPPTNNNNQIVVLKQAAMRGSHGVNGRLAADRQRPNDIVTEARVELTSHEQTVPPGGRGQAIHLLHLPHVYTHTGALRATHLRFCHTYLPVTLKHADGATCGFSAFAGSSFNTGCKTRTLPAAFRQQRCVCVCCGHIAPAALRTPPARIWRRTLRRASAPARIPVLCHLSVRSLPFACYSFFGSYRGARPFLLRSPLYLYTLG